MYQHLDAHRITQILNRHAFAQGAGANGTATAANCVRGILPRHSAAISANARVDCVGTIVPSILLSLSAIDEIQQQQSIQGKTSLATPQPSRQHITRNILNCAADAAADPLCRRRCCTNCSKQKSGLVHRETAF